MTLRVSGGGSGSSITILESVDGWKAAAESWTYATSKTATLPGDVTGIYAIGDRAKLIQSGAVKYFYITGVQYVSPNTTLTLTGGSDYTLANAAISSPSYSKAASPTGFPNFFNWVPTWIGYSVAPPAIGANYRFSLTGRMCYLHLDQINAGTSNSIFTTFVAPIASARASSMVAATPVSTAEVMDNGITLGTPGRVRTIPGTTTMYVTTDLNNGGWTASGPKRIIAADVTYEIGANQWQMPPDVSGLPHERTRIDNERGMIYSSGSETNFPNFGYYEGRSDERSKFIQMVTEAFKGPHGRNQHFSMDDEFAATLRFPYTTFDTYNTAQVALGKSSLWCSANYAGRTGYPCYFGPNCGTNTTGDLPTKIFTSWMRMVRTDDPRWWEWIVQNYIKQNLWSHYGTTFPPLPNSWFGVDNGTFEFSTYCFFPGVGATGTAVVSSGAITSFTITNGGAGYEGTTAKISFAMNDSNGNIGNLDTSGTSALAHCAISGGVVTPGTYSGANIDVAGSSYSGTITVYISGAARFIDGTTAKMDSPGPNNETAYWLMMKNYAQGLSAYYPSLVYGVNKGTIADYTLSYDLYQWIQGMVSEDMTSFYHMVASTSFWQSAFYQHFAQLQTMRQNKKTVPLRYIDVDSAGTYDSTENRRGTLDYVLHRGADTYMLTQDSLLEVPPAKYYPIFNALGGSIGDVVITNISGGNASGNNIYSRQCQGGWVYVNWNGASQTVSTLPINPKTGTRQWYEKGSGSLISSITMNNNGTSTGNDGSSYTVLYRDGTWITDTKYDGSGSFVAPCYQPNINPRVGTVDPNQQTVAVTMTTLETSASIYYTMTTDGSVPADPTTSDTLYSGAITISSTTRFKAITHATGKVDSFPKMASYFRY